MADSLQTFSVRSAGKGIILKADLQDLPDDCLVDALNVCLNDPENAIARRRGSRRYSSTKTPMGNGSFDGTAQVVRMFWWARRDPTKKLLIAIVRTGTNSLAELWYNDPTANKTFTRATTKTAGTTFNVGNAPPSIAVLNDLLYIAPGTADAGANLVFDGTYINITVGFNAPAAALTATNSATAGVVSAGAHLWTYTFVDSKTGAESLPGPVSNSLTCPGNKKASFSGATALPSGADVYRLYRNTAGGTIYRLVAEIATIGADADNLTDNLLGYDEPPAKAGSPPTCKFITVHKERALWAHKTDATGQTEPNLVWISQPGHADVVDVLDAIAVRRDDGDHITGLAQVYGVPYVFKREHIYELVEDADFIYRAEPVLSDGAVGTISPATICCIEGKVFFLSEAGLAVLEGRTVRILVEQMSTLTYIRQDAPQLVAFNIRNNDIATETLHCRVRVYSDAGMSALVATYATATTPTNWTAGGAAFPSGGVTLAPGATASITLDPTAGLVVGTTYHLRIDTWDGTEWTAVDDVVSLTYSPNLVNWFTTSINWAQAEKFFAIDYWPRGEYWCFVASNGASTIDTVLVWDYRANRLTKHSTYATAACMTEIMAMTVGGRQSVWPILGDANGCTWAAMDEGYIERDLLEGNILRSGSCVVSGAGPYTLTDAGAAWPTAGTNVTGLRGTQIALVDANGFVYQGIITGNTGTAITVRVWLHARVPGSGSYTYHIGGLDSFMLTPWYSMDDGDHAKQFKQLLLDADATAGKINVAGYFSPATGEFNTTNWLAWRKYNVAVDARGGAVRIPISGRRQNVCLRLGNVEAGSPFVIRSWGLKFIAPGGRA